MQEDLLKVVMTLAWSRMHWEAWEKEIWRKEVLEVVDEEP